METKKYLSINFLEMKKILTWLYLCKYAFRHSIYVGICIGWGVYVLMCVRKHSCHGRNCLDNNGILPTFRIAIKRNQRPGTYFCIVSHILDGETIRQNKGPSCITLGAFLSSLLNWLVRFRPKPAYSNCVWIIQRVKSCSHDEIFPTLRHQV